MIDPQMVRELADRHQTTTENIVLEYFQHLFLSHLYREKDADGFLFKGGTALRIVWKSPRFSEDLDFTGSGAPLAKIESVLERTLMGVEKEGVEVEIHEAKRTSGGYFSILQFKVSSLRGRVQLEVSLRPSEKKKGVMSLAVSDFLPPYTLIHLEESVLVKEKINALLTRGKPRDFYDLYFILRGRLAFHSVFSRDKALKARILEALRHQKLDLKNELKRFLPASQYGLLKDFKTILRTEVERNLPG